ncbi:prefoldin subunit alpha [Conexivisphaera calida]|uniref:Prefoldin subunit alpha n=1 Tax=Conexivisphaera calida TaxID=1874277 RepID=A0A4P2VGG2_9ARCH|nr:prefoldin subunit alpha [Conexivisphaera calida]BBE42967.1 Prefoldin alpha subunit [Conexivisphaera calida]
MSDQQELQTLAYSARILREYLSELVQRETLISRLIAEHRAALDSMNNLPSGEGDIECMMPLGGGVSVPASVSGSAKYLVAVGAGVFMKKDRSSTIEFLNRKLQELEAALRDISAQRGKVEEELAKLEDRLNSMYQGEPAGSA